MFKKEENKNNLTIVNFSLIIFLVFALFYILYIGQSLIVPFIISILFAFAILGLSKFYEKYRIPSFLAMTLSVITYILVFYFIGNIIYGNINELIVLAPSYQEKIVSLAKNLFDSLGINRNQVTEFMSNIRLQDIFNSIFATLTSLSSNIGAILFYTIFILLEAKYFGRKIELMVSNPDKRKDVLEVLHKIENDVKGYFFIKIVVSLMTAILSYIIMISFGLNFALFWALLVFILNFIPNIGSIIAVMFPSLLSFVQPEFTIYTSIFMVVLLTTIQMIVGNVIEPKMMGNKLNLSPLVIIIALSFWGYLWGIIGMLLSVPLVVIMNIILSKFEQTRPISIFLSEKGEVATFPGSSISSKDEKHKIIEEIKKKFSK
ncbi:AI-2E family transporter [Candidatus Gracilibacteria bacterium]|nr:MAG: AI-2E family transporter [Candidatus Gracilibacteria bacterium]